MALVVGTRSHGRIRVAIVCAVVVVAMAIGLWLLLSNADGESQRGAAPHGDAHRNLSLSHAAPADSAEQNGKTTANSARPLRWDESSCNEIFSALETSIGQVAMEARLAWESRKAEQGITNILERAAQSSVPLERAAALHLQAKTKASEARSLLSKQFPGCRPGLACAKEFEAGLAAATLADRDAIAQLAMSSADPQLYALAYRTCKQQVDGFCQHISAAQWARRDPNNGTAWLYAASEAKAAQQNQAYEDALYKLSISTRFDDGRAALGATLDSLSADTDSPLARVRLNMQSVGSMTDNTNFSLASDYCKGDALQNPNRQPVCESIANTLVQNGDSLLARAMGLGIGSSLHWAPERMAALREEQDALAEMFTSKVSPIDPGAANEGDALSLCRSMVRHASNKSRDLRLGEIGSLKAQIAEQPESLSTLARRYREKHKTGVAATL